MKDPVIIAVAITGAVPRKKDNPALPVTPEEQIESTHEAFEAGASLVHIHVRNPDESPDTRGGRYGAMTDARWEAFFKEMSASGALPATFDYRKAYTLQFVKDL